MDRKYHNIRFSLLIFVLVLWGVMSSVFMGCTPSKGDCEVYPVSFIPTGIEADTRFLILETGDIVFSANHSEHFSFYRYDGISVNPFDTLKDQRFPFLFGGKVVGLQDHDGDEKWIPTSEVFNDYFGGRDDFQSIFSFKNGNLLVVKLKNDRRIYLLDVPSGTKEVLFQNISNLHHVDYSKNGEHLIINFDNQLFQVEPDGGYVELLFKNEDGHKLNPFIWQNYVYFSSNADSEYFKVYRIDLETKKRVPELIHNSDNDVRVPKRYGDNLFFIEVVEGEYLLKKKNLNTGDIQSITQKGVIYTYDLYEDDSILYAYSDFNTPKSLYLYGINEGTLQNLVNQSLELSVSYRHIEKSAERSSAYEYFPVDTNEVRGIILFFRPGLRSDFSPRWDPILNNLANNGFRIIAPNYPMSFGFGKDYNNAPFGDAKDDMIGWIDFLKEHYGELPLYCLASSSGNILMEHVLVEAHGNVNATVSLFGIPAFNKSFSIIPSLYILGENDPIVEFRTLKESFEQSRNSNIHMVSYPDEGHWFRKSENLENAIMAIVEHYCTNDGI